jgi:hypothetical protein
LQSFSREQQEIYLPNEIYATIALKSPYEAILEECKVNKVFNEICKSRKFWSAKVEKELELLTIKELLKQSVIKGYYYYIKTLLENPKFNVRISETLFLYEIVPRLQVGNENIQLYFDIFNLALKTNQKLYKVIPKISYKQLRNIRVEIVLHMVPFINLDRLLQKIGRDISIFTVRRSNRRSSREENRRNPYNYDSSSARLPKKASLTWLFDLLISIKISNADRALIEILGILKDSIIKLIFKYNDQRGIDEIINNYVPHDNDYIVRMLLAFGNYETTKKFINSKYDIVSVLKRPIDKLLQYNKNSWKSELLKKDENVKKYYENLKAVADKTGDYKKLEAIFGVVKERKYKQIKLDENDKLYNAIDELVANKNINAVKILAENLGNRRVKIKYMLASGQQNALYLNRNSLAKIQDIVLKPDTSQQIAGKADYIYDFVIEPITSFEVFEYIG